MVRVRFAPSPTGPLHIGGVRTALYNYLFAKKNNGVFILRIEDTDQTRFVEGAEEYIMESLEWCGIHFDEGIREGGNYGPYRQSERKAIYREYADLLLDNGSAYYAFDTPEELDKLRQEHESQGKIFTYNSSVRGSLKNSLALPKSEWESLLSNETPYVIRFKTEDNSEIEMVDLIRGDIKVNSSTLDDKVLYKSDGMPTYHLANIVDDHLMEITHVIRGEEWLPSLPLHVSLYRAFGWKEPEFAHLPLLLKPEGKGKLSKRDGDKMGFPVFPLYWPHGETARGYREDGYLPDAFVNMLALLGWNPGTEQEIFSMEELIGSFELERISKSGAKFDPEKAKWFNFNYLQKADDSNLIAIFEKELEKRGYSNKKEMLSQVVPLIKERLTFTSEFWSQASFFFEAPRSYDADAVAKRWKSETGSLLRELNSELHSMEDNSSAEIEAGIKNWIASRGYNMGVVMNGLRLLLVGELKGPSVSDIIFVIGIREAVTRIESGISSLTKE